MIVTASQVITTQALSNFVKRNINVRTSRAMKHRSTSSKFSGLVKRNLRSYNHKISRLLASSCTWIQIGQTEGDPKSDTMQVCGVKYVDIGASPQLGDALASSGRECEDKVDQVRFVPKQVPAATRFRFLDICSNILCR